MNVIIYTDGACKGNPGPGGWGALIESEEGKLELWGGDKATTNNRMELMAAIIALETLSTPSAGKIHTDSQYVLKGITEWISGWRRRNWMTADKTPVKNAELWKRLDVANKKHTMEWVWVRGHTGNPGNEQADALANKGIKDPAGGQAKIAR